MTQTNTHHPYSTYDDEPIKLPMRSSWVALLVAGALAAVVGFGIAKLSAPHQLESASGPAVLGARPGLEVSPLPLKSQKPALAPAEPERPETDGDEAAETATPTNQSDEGESGAANTSAQADTDGTPVDDVMLRLRTYRDEDGRVIRRETEIIH